MVALTTCLPSLPETLRKLKSISTERRCATRKGLDAQTSKGKKQDDQPETTQRANPSTQTLRLQRLGRAVLLGSITLLSSLPLSPVISSSSLISAL